MLSRIADSLFWLNRYMERADGMIRVMKTNFALSLDKGGSDSLNWRPSLELFAAIDGAAIASAENSTKEALRHLITNTDNVNSLKVIVTRARENARGVQDNITKEVWEQVNQLYHLINQPAFSRKLTDFGAMEAMDTLTRHLVLFAGVTETTMPRGIGWSFMNLGKQIERCLLTIEMTNRQFKRINYQLENTSDILQWRFLLLSLSGYELYLKNYRTNNYNHNVLHQTIFNVDFTRSLIYSLKRIDRYLEDVTTENNNTDNISLLHSFGRLHSMVRYTDFEILNNSSLELFFKNIKNDILGFIKKLEQNFFSYS